MDWAGVRGVGYVGVEEAGGRAAVSWLQQRLTLGNVPLAHECQ